MTPDSLLSTLLLPLLGGLAVGFVGGLITGILATLRWVARRRDRGAAVPIYTDEANPNPGHVPWRGREHLSRLGWILAFLGIIGVLLGSFSLYRNTQTANCVAEFNTRFSLAQRERAAAAELDRQAIRQQRQVTREFNGLLIDSINNPAVDEAAREKARTDFLAKIRDWDGRLAEVDRLDQAAEEQRKQNPLPPTPDC